MLIQIRPPDGATPAVWAMIELQGEIERNEVGEPGAGFDVGTLSTSSTGSLYLTIGYHQLEGKVQPLKKPLAVLRKVTDDDDADDDVDVDGDVLMANKKPPTREYKVVGIVREKVLFKARPRALISKPKS